LGQNNSRRISHTLENLPNTYRDDQVRQILDDLDEENSGLGYSEVIRVGAFVSKITVWDSNAMNFKKTEAIFNRTGPFINSIVKNVYSVDGSSIISTVTASVTRTGNNSVAFVDVVNVRS